MKEYVEFTTEDGETFVAEVESVRESPKTSGRTSASRSEAGRTVDAARKASKTFEEALSALRPATDALKEHVRALQPDEVTVEFGIKLNATSGVVLASAGTEANFKVTLTWTTETPDAN